MEYRHKYKHLKRLANIDDFRSVLGCLDYQRQKMNDCMEKKPKDNLVSVTYKCDEHIVDEFRKTCMGRNISPGRTLEKLMKEFNLKMLKQDLKGL